MSLSRQFLVLIAGAFLGLYGSANAYAATINFSDTAISANVGDTITLDILMDFTGDPTLGGGTDIFYDASVLSFQSFDFGTTTLALDPAFSRSPDELANELEGLAFGSFAGLEGPGTVGTLTFQAISIGDITLTMAVTDKALKGGDFISATDSSVQTVTFGTANISVSQIPVPAALWLFISGLLGLSALSRRRSNTL